MMLSSVKKLFNPSTEKTESTYTLNPDASETVTADGDVPENEGDDSHSEPTTPANTPIDPRRRWYILEPVIFLVYFAINLSSVVFQNQILYQSCITKFLYNETDCQPLLGVIKPTPDTPHIEDVVQPYVSRILMVRSLIDAIIPAVISLFIGSWSDKFGRRPILLGTIVGYLIGYFILTLITLIATKVVVTPWLYLLSSVPSGLTGGTCALIVGVYCYISDVAIDKGRRLVINGASLGAGVMIGNLVSGYLYAVTNVITLFSLSAIILVLAFIYIYVYVLESLEPEQIQTGSKVREFFRFDLVKDLVLTCFSRRANFDRAIILITMTCLVVATFVSEGDSNVTYLFLRKKFEWTLQDYSTFQTISTVVQIVGSIIGVILLRRVLKVSIEATTLISVICCVLESTMRGFATAWWELYLGMGLGFMRGIMTPMLSAIIAHVVPGTEVGKIFALTNSLQTLSPLGAAPLYTTVYNATFTFYPGVFNFISAGLYLLCFTLIASVCGIQLSLGTTAIDR